MLAALPILIYRYSNGQYLEIISSAGKNVFQVELATTPKELQFGLMYRKELADDQGMLFIFERPAIQSFWMKNTYIPLDIIFISDDWRIINIAENSGPCLLDPCTMYYSSGPAKYVLEIKAGLSKEKQIQVGNQVYWPH